MSPFTPDVVAAVTRHMNDDHPEDCVVMVRGLGGVPTATAATLIGVDGTGFDFEAIVDGAPVAVRIPSGAPLTERTQIRVEVVRLYDEACTALGLPPHDPASQH